MVNIDIIFPTKEIMVMKFLTKEITLTSLTVVVSNAGGHSHNVGNAGSHSHNVAVESTGQSGTNRNLPPYMGLFYIIRIK
jgi:hypothetical protein